VLDERFFRGNTITIVTTGRLALPKNHILAVKAAKILRDKGVDFKWLFIGEGSERPKIENLIKEYALSDQVILFGMRSNPYPFMARCDVYVQTSSFEGFGLTIAEAKILGKPVVSTNFDVVHDQLKHGENGLIAEMTPESVAENIIHLLEDDNLRNQIVANVKREKNTTFISEVEKVEKLLDAD
jgi:glycosyltransferase involved in cell wall biosynthesis